MFAFYLVLRTDEENLDFHRIGRVECRSIRSIHRPPDSLNTIATQAAMRIKVWAVGSSEISNYHPTDIFGSKIGPKAPKASS